MFLLHIKYVYNDKNKNVIIYNQANDSKSNLSKIRLIEIIFCLS